MVRPLRLEFAGAIYHVTSRGDRREAIYDDHENRAYLRPSKPIDIAYGITYAIHFKELLCPL